VTLTEPGAETPSEAGYRLHAEGRLTEAEACYRDALALRPEYPEVWNNLGLVQLTFGRLTEAELSLREALRLNPDFADAHNNLGLVHYRLSRVAEAENCFRGCLRLHPGHPNATINLGTAQQSLGRLDEAEAMYHQALLLGVEPARALNNLAVLHLEQGRPGESEARCREALALNPGNPDARTNLAMVLLLTGRLTEGWEAYEARWALPAMAPEACPVPARRWFGDEPLAGRTILLHAEQGFGDTLQFCRYVPLVAALGAHVVLAVQPALVRLMRSLDGTAQVFATGDHLPPVEFHCPLMSLPLAFRTNLETVPVAPRYLSAAPAHTAAWRNRLADLPGVRIGLVWAGSSRTDQPHAAAIDRRRSMRLANLAPLAAVPGCSFVSLQLGPPTMQLREPPPGLVVHDFTAELGDFADTAALVEALDLVISVDTAVAHLASALGRPVWLLNRYDTCWRWLRNRDDSPWYPALRQFRQQRAGDWDGVVAAVADALAGWVTAPARR
jgi:Flp pilus assembly protein TadD